MVRAAAFTSGDAAGAMGKKDTGDMRKNVGRFNAKVGKKELKTTHEQAIAKRQDPIDMKPYFLYMAIFGAACGLLYVYLQWFLADDDEISDEELAAATASSKLAQ